MTERFSRPRPLEITPLVFEDIASSPEMFAAKIRKHYVYLCFHCSYEPVLNETRLEDAFVAFQRDKKHAARSMPEGGKPNHFKLCGILAYWLRRFAPVYDLRDLSMVRDAPESLSSMLRQYPSELPAFEIGLSVCDFFERGKKDGGGSPAVDKNNLAYYSEICYLMKFKSLSPHSMGMIYRSLYVPVGPA